MSNDKPSKEMLGKGVAKHTARVLTSYTHAIELLEEAVKEEKWFKGLVLSATFFEMIGSIMLKAYYEQIKGPKHQRKIAEFLGRAGFKRIVTLLYLCDLIKPETYSKMVRIVDARGKLIHRVQRKTKYLVFENEISRENKKKALKLTADAIECLKELGAS